MIESNTQRFRYTSGVEVLKGDRIIYHGEPGIIEFVVRDRVGDPALDWYLEVSPGGGVMILASGFGNVFMEELDEDTTFVSRRTIEGSANG